MTAASIQTGRSGGSPNTVTPPISWPVSARVSSGDANDDFRPNRPFTARLTSRRCVARTTQAAYTGSAPLPTTMIVFAESSGANPYAAQNAAVSASAGSQANSSYSPRPASAASRARRSGSDRVGGHGAERYRVPPQPPPGGTPGPPRRGHEVGHDRPAASPIASPVRLSTTSHAWQARWSGVANSWIVSITNGSARRRDQQDRPGPRRREQGDREPERHEHEDVRRDVGRPEAGPGRDGSPMRDMSHGRLPSAPPGPGYQPPGVSVAATITPRDTSSSQATTRARSERRAPRARPGSCRSRSRPPCRAAATAASSVNPITARASRSTGTGTGCGGASSRQRQDVAQVDSCGAWASDASRPRT